MRAIVGKVKEGLPRTPVGYIRGTGTLADA